ETADADAPQPLPKASPAPPPVAPLKFAPIVDAIAKSPPTKVKSTPPPANPIRNPVIPRDAPMPPDSGSDLRRALELPKTNGRDSDSMFNASLSSLVEARTSSSRPPAPNKPRKPDEIEELVDPLIFGKTQVPEAKEAVPATSSDAPSDISSYVPPKPLSGK